MKIRRLNSTGFAALSLSILAVNAMAQNSSDSEKTNTPPEKAKVSAGLLPVPDYSADFWTREYLTGDWGGARTSLADHGVQLGVLWDQYVQGVADGGRERTTKYGGTVDYTVNLDLMKMNVLPGALIKFRAESRYGRSVNGDAGPIFPVNTDAFFPLTSKLDADVPFTITDLNYTQFLSQHLGVFFGKLDTLDADLNEFASGQHAWRWDRLVADSAEHKWGWHHSQQLSHKYCGLLYEDGLR